MNEGQPRKPKRSDSDAGSNPRPSQKLSSDAVLMVPSVSRVQAKALKNLDETLRAMRSSLDKAKQFVAMGRQKFDDDWMVQDAAITTVTQIAEAAKRLPKSFRDARPEVPWRNVIGMRDIMIHEYAIIDLPLVWEALEQGFPQIEESVFPE
jgi:uncharacterized protein with HEPN domain